MALFTETKTGCSHSTPSSSSLKNIMPGNAAMVYVVSFLNQSGLIPYLETKEPNAVIWQLVGMLFQQFYFSTLTKLFTNLTLCAIKEEID